MRPVTDGALFAASLAFAGAAGVGSVVAVREHRAGRPFGISVPLSVPAGLLAGWGAGVAAPWPMPAAAVIAAARAGPAASGALPGAICAGIGMGCIRGHCHRACLVAAPVLDPVDQGGDRLQCDGVGRPHRGRVASRHSRASRLS